MVDAVGNKRNLEARMDRFLRRERSRDARLVDVLDVLGSEGRGFLFGGVVRDIALAGIDKFDSDIDVVVEGEGLEVDEVCREYGAKTNRFGGYRVQTDNWLVDFWRVQDTWAVREGIVEYNNVESLLGTTPFNWDSVLLGLNSGSIICGANYLDELQRRYFDVVLEENPNPLGLATRMLRAIAKWEDVELSVGAVETMKRMFGRYSYREIKAYEVDHFNAHSVGESMYFALEKCVFEGGAEPVRWSGQMVLF